MKPVKKHISLEFQPDLIEKLNKKNLAVSGMAGSGPQWLAARFARQTGRPMLWISDSAQEAEEAAANLSFFLPGHIIHFPGHDSHPFLPIAPSPGTVCRRIQALHTIREATGPFICVTHICNLLEPVIPPNYLMNHAEYVMAGEETDRDSLLQWFITAGYEHVSIVQAHGEFCVRGSLVDFFPPGDENAVRLDFFGDTVEEIRFFDPLTQRSTGTARELIILPASELLWLDERVEQAKKKIIEAAVRYEWSARNIHTLLNRLSEKRVAENHRTLYPFFYEKTALLHDYLPHNTLAVFQRPDEIVRQLDTHMKKIGEAWESALADSRVLCPLEHIVQPPDRIFSKINTMQRWYYTDIIAWPPHGWKQEFFPEDTETIDISCILPDLPPISARLTKGEGLLGPAFERLAAWQAKGIAVCLVCPGKRHAARMVDMMAEYLPDIPISRMQPGVNHEDEAFPDHLDSDPSEPGIYVFAGILSRGFQLKAKSIVVVTEEELLGTSARRARRIKKRRARAPVTFEDLKIGHPLVHVDHGIAVYQGMIRMDTGGTQGEFLILEYQKGDRLYLPVDRLSLIQKYTGIEGRKPRVDRLGGTTWKIRRQKVKRSIYRIAHELVDLYAARKVRRGIPFSPPGPIFRQFEAEFPYDETPDQARAIQEIISDMQARSPMDRLLCGDVGYGKTEVALRAAFKAVEDGMQVAVLVPTTLLAEQHERTFRQRLRRFPAEVAALSRLKSRREQKQILEKARLGAVDILIGTHRLLQSDVQFKNIGLLIVDEEHRFGVKHKEKLKNLRQNMDSLALTATPIPRTLQLSMLSIRDMSTINSPPALRLPVKTYLAEFDEALIKTAVNNEISRGGQVFFVHNRVKGIHTVADHLQRLCPDIRIDVAHGQMSPAELEKIMIAFVRGEINCLVCTTIIESGIDIPAANTMIINRADSLGLADMYQLRGRVGRGNEQAYAYLMVSRLGHMSRDAAKRIRAIMDFSTSGGGFRLAMQDLRIRGAGNILGVSQSGQIADVGYDMYLDLLQKAVDELKGMSVMEEIEPEINLQIPAYIPEEYIPDPGQRLEIYRRMSQVRGPDRHEDIKKELQDRFGKFPREVINLQAVMEIKELLRSLNAIRLDIGRTRGISRMILTFHHDGPPGPDSIVQEATRRKRWTLLPDSRLAVEIKSWEEDAQLTDNVKRYLQSILETAKN